LRQRAAAGRDAAKWRTGRKELEKGRQGWRFVGIAIGGARHENTPGMRNLWMRSHVARLRCV